MTNEPEYRIRWRAVNSGVTGQSNETYTEAEARRNCSILNRLNPSIHNWFVMDAPAVTVEPESNVELRQAVSE